MREGELDFDFTAAKHVEKLDEKGRKLPQGMMFVDFVLEEDDQLIMLEIKDPSSKPKGDDLKAEVAIQKQRDEFIIELRKDDWIAQKLTPKARDSFTYLHLMERDIKPIIYVLLIGSENLSPLDPALLVAFKDRLFARLCQETEQPWVRQYVIDCLVLTEKTWPLAFPQYALTRIS